MAIIGSAHIVVKAITTGFQRDVREALKGMRPALEKEGQQSAKSFSKGFKDQSKTSLENFDPLRGTKPNFEKSGQSSAKSFATSFKQQSSESLKNFDPFRGKQSQFRDSGASAGKSFGAGMKRELRTQLADLDSVFDKGGKRAGKAFAQSFKQNTKDSLSNFDPTRGTRGIYSEAGRRASAAFTADFKRDIKLALKDLEDDFYRSGSKAGKRFQQGFRDNTKNFKKYFSDLFKADDGSGFIGRFLSSLTGGFGNFRQQALAANDAFFRLVTTGYLIGPAIAGVISSLSALVSGLFAVAAAAASAAPALIVLPGILVALGQAAIVAKLAFSGIGEAIKGLRQESGGAGASVVNANRQIEQAERRLAQVLESNREALVRADRNLERAERDLTEARLEAAESLQQLNFDAEDAALSEKRAALQLEKAREALARVQDLPPNSRARREAELAYAEADLNLRRAKDRNSDLAKETEEANKKGVEGSDQVVAATERLQEAVDGKARAELDALRAQIDAEEALAAAKESSAAAGGGASTAAFDKLNASAQEFVTFIVEEFLPAVDDLKAAAASKIFEPLTEALRLIAKDLFPVLEPIFEDTGEAIGNVALEIAKVITEGKNLEEIERIGGTNVVVIENLGTAFGYLLDSALSLLDAARPLITRFSEWVVVLTRGWSETLEAKNKTGELTDMFNQAGDVAAQLGDIFGNIWDALMNIGKAAAGPGSGGQMLLDLFENATAGWAEFTQGALKDGSLEQYFIDVAENFAAISGFISDVIREFGELGDNEGVKGFFDGLRENDVVGTIGGMLDRLTSAGPAMAEFFGELTETIDYFTETESIENFFGVLTGGLEVLNTILENETVRKVFLWTAGIMGAMKGFQILFKVGGFALKVIAGYFFKLIDVIGKVFSILGGITRIFMTSFGIAAGPAAALTAAVVAVVASLILMWQNSEKLRDAVKKLISAGIDALKAAFDRIKEAVNKALEPFGGMEGATKSLGEWFGMLGDVLATYVVPIIQDTLVFAIDLAAEAISLFIGIVSGIIQVFQGVWEFVQGIFALFKGDMDGMSEHFSAGFDKIKGAFVTVFEFVIDFFAGVIEAIIGFLTPWEVDIGEVFTRIGAFISLVWDGIKTAFSAVWDFIKRGFEIGATVIEVAINKIKTAFDAVKTGMQWAYDNVIKPLVIDSFKTAIDGVKTAIDKIKTAFNLVKTGITTAWDTIKTAALDKFETALNGIKTVIDGLKTAFNTLKDAIIGAFRTAFNFIVDIWNNSVGKLDVEVPDWVPVIGGKGFSVPKMQKWYAPAAGGEVFARGGLVLRPTMGLVGEAGPELIIPLRSDLTQRREELLKLANIAGSSSGEVVVNMTVNPSPGMDEAELAAAVSRELAFQLRKGAMR